MATFEASSLNVALPSIARDFSCPIDTVAWVVLAYTLGVIALMLLFGAWAERRGWAFAYTFGYIFFTFGSAACALSPNIAWLVVGRVVQAVGTAVFAATGPALVTTVFPPEERGKGIGMMVMVVSIGFMTGPPIGGLLIGLWDWPLIFLAVVPVGIVGLWLTRKYFPGVKTPNSGRRVPIAASLTMSAALVSGVYGLTQIADNPISEAGVWVPLLTAAVFLMVFLRIEADPSRAFIGLAILRNSRFVLSVAAQQTHFIAYAGVMLLMPFYLETVRSMTPQEVGMYLVILPVLMLITAPISGRLSDRIGYRFLSASGMLAVAIGLFLMSSLAIDTETSYIVIILVVLGAGAGIFSSPNASAFMGSVTAEQRLVTSAILATGRNIAMTVGIALATALFTYFGGAEAATGDNAEAFVRGYHPVIWVSVAVALAGTVICLVRKHPEIDTDYRKAPTQPPISQG
jgi:EmrB/QacA subfamily drug resistance transporter